MTCVNTEYSHDNRKCTTQIECAYIHTTNTNMQLRQVYMEECAQRLNEVNICLIMRILDSGCENLVSA